MRKPNLFIVGAPKCGTSAMHSYLRQHPEIYMAPGTREPQYFGSDIRFPWFPELTEDSYLQIFSGENGEPLVGEKSTTYLASELAAAEIKAFSPGAYIVAMLRNPVDMIYSLHSQMLFQGYETIPDFHTALMARTDRPIDPYDAVPGTSNFNGRIYWEITRYAEQLQRYFDVFGREKVHVIIYDDLKRDTAAVYADTLRFLRVDPDFKPELAVVNPNKQYRSNLAARPPSLVRRVARAVMPKFLRRGVRAQITRFNISYQSRKVLDPDLRIKLQQEFAVEVERAGRLLDRDLSHWSKST